MKMTKKVLSILLSLMLVLGSVAVGGMTASADDDGIAWNATENRYEISSYAGLKAFADIVNGTSTVFSQNTAACGVLADDIVCKNSPDDTDYATDWTPIGNNDKKYTGTFDGGGHKIAGLTFNNTSADYVGLFGCVGEGGKVQNVGLEGGSITGRIYVGGVAGANDSGTFTNCYNTGDVSGVDYVGGVLGLNDSCTVTNCYNTGDISGSNYVGGVSGANDSGTFTNCYNTGDVSGMDYVGGVLGLNDSGTVTNCYNAGAVSGTFYVGGAVGLNDGTITNCYNTGSVTATADHAYVGGVVGYNYDNSSVENCYNTGSVTATGNDAFVCGVVGLNIGTVRYCYYDKSVCGEIGAVAIADDNTDNVKGLSTAEMTGTSAIGTADNQMNFSDTSVWLVRAADEFYSYYPHLKGFDLDKDGNQLSAGDIRKTDWPARLLKDGVREISDYDELKEFASAVNGGETDACAVLVSDIDASASAETNDWTPIGNDFNNYTGTFDGDGHKITGLTFNNTSAECVGLFCFVGEGGKVQNVGLEGGSITGDRYVGGVAGYNSGTVTNCYNTGGVSGGYYVGGVVGYNYGTITNCYNTGSVTAPGSNASVGGVDGYNYGTVTNCYNTGNVSGGYYVGGVVGFNYSSTISNCYNTGSVTATADYAYVGGVAGYNFEGTITNCYNTGGVTSQGSNASVGGVTGYNSNETIITNCYNTGSVITQGNGARVGGVAGYNSDGTITNCYNTGSVTAPETGVHVGGVVGRNYGTVRYCYYDKSVCVRIGAVDGADDDTNNVTGLTTAQMTGESALENMAFSYGPGEESPWLTKANNENSSYYPHLKGFAYDADTTDANWPPKIEAPVTTYPLWVGGNQVTSENMGALEELDGISVDEGGSVKFEPDADGTGGTLYLNNATITGMHEFDYVGVFTSNILVENTDFDLTINLEGENIINGGADKAILLPSSTFDAALKIEGEGSIDVTAVEGAVFCEGYLTVDGTTLTATATLDDEGSLPDGIYSRETIIIGSTVIATASGSNGTGFYCQGSLDIDGSVVTATGVDSGIYVDNEGSLTVSGESVITANGGSDFCGILVTGDFIFNNGNDILTPEEYTIGAGRIGKIIYSKDGNVAKTVIIGQPCTVAFNNYDGTELQSGKILKGTAPEYKGETPTRTDPSGGYTYAFSGWKDGNNNEYAPGAAFPVAEGDITYTAQFTETPVDYTVTFFVDGKQFSQLTVPFGAPVSSPRTPQKDNYDFTGWDAEIPEKMPAQNLEFNAVFKAIEYTASFIADGETVEEVKFTIEDDSIDEPAVPEKEGYEGKWTAYTLAAADITIKAEYTAIEYTATFVDENGETVEEVPYTVETESINEPAVPEKQGYAGEWEEYELTIGGITVRPVYTGNTSIELEGYTDSIEIGYKEDKTFNVKAKNLPEGAEIHWFVNGEDVGTGDSYTVEDPTDDYTIQAKAVDKDGNTLDETQVQAVKVRNGFMDKLKWFFSDFWNNIFKAVIDAIIKAC